MPFPATTEELKQAGYKFDRCAYCRGCGALIEWWITPHGKRMPMNVSEDGKAEAHWATCPQADRFRKNSQGGLFA